MTHASTPTTFPFGGNKRLKSQDSVWIVTDVRTYTASLYPWSQPQRWYRAGALDLRLMHLVLAEWSTDDMRAILKAGMTAGIGSPPWSAPQSHGFELVRLCHGGQEKGRFRETVSLVEVDEETVRHGGALRRYFERTTDLCGNVPVGSLRSMLDSVARENAIEAAARTFSEWFSAGDVKAVVGSDMNVTRILARMVEDGVLVTNGKAKRGCRYMPAPPTPVIQIERADWTA